MKFTLKQWRGIKNVTQRQLAEVTGAPSVAAWESGGSTPTFEQYVIMHNFLGLGKTDVIDIEVRNVPAENIYLP